MVVSDEKLKDGKGCRGIRGENFQWVKGLGEWRISNGIRDKIIEEVKEQMNELGNKRERGTGHRDIKLNYK